MIHERINRRRQVEGMNIEELSAISGISCSRLADFEANTETPDSAELIKLGRALGVNVHYFFRPILFKKEDLVFGKCVHNGKE